MSKFRKKPVVIEAVQFFKAGDHPAVRADDTSPTGFGIHTLEHTSLKHEVTPGDWIITGVAGEVYACKPDIFEATYSPADEGDDAIRAAFRAGASFYQASMFPGASLWDFEASFAAYSRRQIEERRGEAS